MGDLSLLEKLKVFVDVSSSSGICIASIFILLFMAFMFLTTNRKNAKASKLLFIGIYVVLILVMLFQYQDSLYDMFDYMMNNFFIVFYFPNLAIYLAAIFATNIILMISIFNYKEDKLVKVVNTIIYCIIHYLLILILNIVNVKNLDVFSQSSVYGNEKASALISLTSIIFIVWIIFLVIYKIIRHLQKGHQEQAVQTQYIEVPVKKINPNIMGIEAPKIVNGGIKKKPDVIPIEEVPPNLVQMGQPQDIQQPLVEIEKDRELLKEYENMFTLEDYKLVLELLKNNKKQSNINPNVDNHTIMVEEKEEPINDISSIDESKRIKDAFPSKLDQLLNI